MKNIFIYLIILTTGFSACKKDDDDNPTTPVPTVYDNHSSVLMQRMHSMSDSMHMMQMSGDPDLDFAKMMMMHHHGAIDMATYELANGNDNFIKDLAQSMKDMQITEVQMLDAFIMSHTPNPITTGFAAAAMKSMEMMDNNADAQVLNGDSDHDFAHLMLPHHQSAMEMAHSEIEFGQVQMLKDMAQDMINAQQMEINNLQIWLNSNN